MPLSWISIVRRRSRQQLLAGEVQFSTFKMWQHTCPTKWRQQQLPRIDYVVLQGRTWPPDSHGNCRVGRLARRPGGPLRQMLK